MFVVLGRCEDGCVLLVQVEVVAQEKVLMSDTTMPLSFSARNHITEARVVRQLQGGKISYSISNTTKVEKYKK